MATIRIVGPGRAGQSLSRALGESGWEVLPLLGRGDDLADAADGADLLVLSVPDDAIAEVSAAVRPSAATVVVHLAGSLGPEVLAPHPRRAALHPLVALPDAETGARRLQSKVTFTLSGDPGAAGIAEALGGSVAAVPDGARATYHAAACIAANHVVALLGQVERVARAAGLPLGAFLPLARAAVEDAGRLGPAAALTGPASRGDWQTLARHLEALEPGERAAYRAGVGLALQLAVEKDPSSRPDGAGGTDGAGGEPRDAAEAASGGEPDGEPEREPAAEPVAGVPARA